MESPLDWTYTGNIDVINLTAYIYSMHISRKHTTPFIHHKANGMREPFPTSKTSWEDAISMGDEGEVPAACRLPQAPDQMPN